MTPELFGGGLASAPLILPARSRSISAENPAGEKGAGGKAAGLLGPGRKGRAFLPRPRGETTLLADIPGTGVVRHIWLTVADQTDAANFVLRDLVLRM